MVFEDVLTFDVENPIVGSLLRKIDWNKKQTDSDFIKSLPSQPGNEFEIKKLLGRLRDIKSPNRKNNNNNNDNTGANLFHPRPGGDGNLFPPGPPGLGPTPPPPIPEEYELQN